MNERDLESIRDYIDGRLHPDQLDALNHLLEHNVEARDIFRRMSAIEEGLQDWAAEALFFPRHDAESHRNITWAQKLKNPLSTAAAGLLMGIFSTILFKTYAITASPYMHNMFTLCFESFESGTSPEVSGLPKELNVWSGDYNKVITQFDSVKADDGTKMFEFLAADYKGKEEKKGYTSDLYRIFDLKIFKHLIKKNKSKIMAEAKYTCSEKYPPDRFMLSISLYAFDALPMTDQAIDDVKFKPTNFRDYSIEHSTRNKKINLQDLHWQVFDCELNVPAESNYLMIHISLVDTSQYKAAKPVQFEGHFLDSVKISLVEVSN